MEVLMKKICLSLCGILITAFQLYSHQQDISSQKLDITFDDQTVKIDQFSTVLKKLCLVSETIKNLVEDQNIIVTNTAITNSDGSQLRQFDLPGISSPEF